MAVQILMPKLGLTMKTGTALKWLKNEGDPVAQAEPVLEIETEKLSHQVEAPASGILIKRLAQVGEKYPVSCVLGYIGAPGESAEETAPEPMAGQTLFRSSQGGRVFISPAAKKLAALQGVDYRGIRGSGPNGRIIKADIKALMLAPKTEAITPTEDAVIPYAGIRRATGERMTAAWTAIPMVTHHVSADVTELAEYRSRLNSGVTDKGERVSFGELILKLTAVALAGMPIINSELTPDGIVTYGSVHLGMATATPGGLLVPVIRDAESKSLLQISRLAKSLAARARSGALGLDEMSGGTFTVSNLGGYGSVDLFTPIINPPQAAILGVGRSFAAAVPVGGEIRIRSMMGLSFTYDHRIIDGATAAEFMAIFLKLLENPARSMLL